MTFTLISRLELNAVHRNVSSVSPGLVALRLRNGFEYQLKEQQSISISPRPSSAYRVFLRISIENLSFLPGVESVVDQGGQHHVVVEVGACRVLVQVDRVEQDPQSVSREAGDGVPERDAVT